jgi:hypothetical protein
MAKTRKPQQKAGPRKMNFSISGRVIDSRTDRRAGNLRVEAWDKDLIFDDLAGRAVTDADGAFQIELTALHICEVTPRPFTNIPG